MPGLFNNTDEDLGTQHDEEQLDLDLEASLPPLDEPEEDESDIEAEARRQGWSPKGKLSAKEFVARGKEIVNNRNAAPIRERDEQIAQLKTQLESMQKGFDASMALAEAQHKKELDSMVKQRRDAIELGDVEEVDRLDKEIEDHKALKPEKPKAKEPEAETPQQVAVREYQAAPDAVKQWIQDNPWFYPVNGETGEPNPQFNRTMARFAAGYVDELKQTNPALTDAALVKMVGKEIRKRFPENFESEEDPMKDLYSGTASRTGSTATTSRSAAISQDQFKRMPKSAQEQYAAFVKKGMIKDSVESRAEFARMYNE